MDFNLLPRELQVSTMLDMDAQTLGRLCQTSFQINQLCKDEKLWKHQFFALGGISKNYIPAIFGTSWLSRTRTLWTLLHPKIVYTVSYIQDYKIKFLAQYLTKDENVAKTCLLSDYDKKIEPVYSNISHIVDSTGKYQQFTETVLNEMLESHDIIIEPNLLYNLGGNSTLNLFYMEECIFSVTGTDVNSAYAMIALMFNYSYTSFINPGEMLVDNNYIKSRSKLARLLQHFSLESEKNIVAGLYREPEFYTENTVSGIFAFAYTRKYDTIILKGHLSSCSNFSSSFSPIILPPPSRFLPPPSNDLIKLFLERKR